MPVNVLCKVILSLSRSGHLTLRASAAPLANAPPALMDAPLVDAPPGDAPPGDAPPADCQPAQRSSFTVEGKGLEVPQERF